MLGIQSHSINITNTKIKTINFTNTSHSGIKTTVEAGMKAAIVAILLGFSGSLMADCRILGPGAATAQDSLKKILSSSLPCPTNVMEFGDLLKKKGLVSLPAMVANRGIHNPEGGSFSFFEEVTGAFDGQAISKGQFFFGHFTGARNGKLLLEQS